MDLVLTQSDFDTTVTEGGVTKVRHHKNDITIDPITHQLSFATGISAYEFIVADVIRTMKGEVQLDTTLGIDYDNTVWASRDKIMKWQRLVRKRLMEFEFVDNIDIFDAWMEGNIFKYKLVITTDLGVATVESED